MEIKVVGFPAEKYKREEVEKLTPREKQEYALSDEDCIIYDDIYSFFNEMNDDFVDTENVFWYPIEIFE